MYILYTFVNFFGLVAAIVSIAGKTRTNWDYVSLIYAFWCVGKEQRDLKVMPYVVNHLDEIR